MRKIENRKSARLILTDDRGRILLFRYAQWSGGTFWATPGGGVDNGETFEQAALREAWEELAASATIIKVLWERTVDLSYEDSDVHQIERYFHIKAESIAFPERVKQEHQQEGIIETRWWTLGEISSATEVIFPEDLASRLAEILK